MADVELVIKIDEQIYKHICNERTFDLYSKEMENSIKNGTMLSKGHGKLIDAGEYENSIRKHYFDNRTVIRCTEIALDNAPTIIDEDKER